MPHYTYTLLAWQVLDPCRASVVLVILLSFMVSILASEYSRYIMTNGVIAHYFYGKGHCCNCNVTSLIDICVQLLSRNDLSVSERKFRTEK